MGNVKASPKIPTLGCNILRLKELFVRQADSPILSKASAAEDAAAIAAARSFPSWDIDWETLRGRFLLTTNGELKEFHSDTFSCGEGQICLPMIVTVHCHSGTMHT